MSKITGIIVLLTLQLFAAQAYASRVHHTGDLFLDEGWAPYGRPSVPSDRTMGSDMIRPVPNFYNSNADLFDGMKPPWNFGREDMMIVRPSRVPADPLFQYPPQK